MALYPDAAVTINTCLYNIPVVNVLHILLLNFIQSGPEKVSHYQVPSLNRIKNRQ